MNKKGAMELSFGMIFAIILIVVFLVFAFFGIKKILAVQEQVKYVQFAEDLQSDVDKIWKSAQASKEVTYMIPSKIAEICFENKETRNLIFNPRTAGFEPKTITNLNFLEMFPEESTSSFCIKTKDGTVSMTLSKEYSQNLVTISR